MECIVTNDVSTFSYPDGCSGNKVCIFKTRNIAANSCKNKKISINNKQISKSSVFLKIGDKISVKFPLIIKNYEVTGFPFKRIGAKLVDKFTNDLTPDSEYKKIELVKMNSFAVRDRGMGRPTKRHRRDIEELRDFKKD